MLKHKYQLSKVLHDAGILTGDAVDLDSSQVSVKHRLRAIQWL